MLLTAIALKYLCSTNLVNFLTRNRPTWRQNRRVLEEEVTSPEDDENAPPASDAPIQEHEYPEDNEEPVGDLDEDTPAEGSEVVDRDQLRQSLKQFRRLERLSELYREKENEIRK